LVHHIFFATVGLRQLLNNQKNQELPSIRVQEQTKKHTRMKCMLCYVLLLCSLVSCRQNQPTTTASEADAAEPVLASWKKAASTEAILSFVKAATDSNSQDFIPAADRIAVFDNDGCLWSEQPYYFQLAYAMDACKAMATQHPEWKNKEPFKSLLAGDVTKVLHSGEKGLLSMVAASHTGMSSDEFNNRVTNWIDTARHPQTGRHYTEMVYQPMLELLQYLRANGFTTYIVSGGGIDFLRAWAERVYGIPPGQVVGSSLKVAYSVIDGKPQMNKLAELNFVDDGPGKPVGIYQHIGKRPVFAAGNSDGDYEMLQYTTTNPQYKSLAILIHHTDEVREYRYDSLSSIGKLKRGLQDAAGMGWKVVNMKTDWHAIFFEN
jgi:phosphoglycolate phosphatase-like HAD superfamily hydrolase